MKNIIVTLSLLTAILGFAQMSVGLETPHQNAILDFGTDGNKGIILPHTNALNVATSSEGTLYYDTAQSKVMLVKNSNALMDLSINKVEAGNEFDVDDVDYAKYKENTNSHGTTLGANPDVVTTIPEGVMVLETQSKFLALPVTTDYKNLATPAPKSKPNLT